MSNKTLVPTTLASAFVFFILITLMYFRISPFIKKAIGYESASITGNRKEPTTDIAVSDTLKSLFSTDAKQSSNIAFYLDTVKFENINEAKKVFFRDYDSDNSGVVKTIPMTAEGAETGSTVNITAEFFLPPQTFYKYSTVDNCMNITLRENDQIYLTLIVDAFSPKSDSECLKPYLIDQTNLEDFKVMGQSDTEGGFLIRSHVPNKDYYYTFFDSFLVQNFDKRSFNLSDFSKETNIPSTIPNLSKTNKPIKYIGIISEDSAKNKKLLEKAELAFYSFSFEEN